MPLPLCHRYHRAPALPPAAASAAASPHLLLSLRPALFAQDMLLALRSVFGDGLLRHVLLGFTRWDYSRRGRLLCEQRHAFACG